jgi:hypothetical protein
MEKMKTENPEKLKEWRHTDYMNRKMKKEQVNNDIK